jgi:PAS domain S-box-containing protein
VRRRTKELRESEHRARSIFEGAKDAILVFGEDLRILNVNAAGEHLWQRAREEFIGHSITQFIENPKGNISDPIGSNIKSGRGEFEAVGIRTDGSKLALSIGLNTVPFGGRDHFVIVVRDVTERNKISEEREKLIKELQNALAKVRTLSGLLPICSSCKKIRDDSGYWKQVEEYLALETDVQFSHGICPDCLERLYPEVARNKRQRLSDALSPKPEQKDQK